jgi:hypothetical protein
MKFFNTLSLESASLIYVEKAFNPEINTFIQSNFKQISAIFNSEDIGFLYLPYLLQNENYLEIVAYNRPYFENNFNNLAVNSIYEKIINQLKASINSSGLIYIDYFSYGQNTYQYFELNERLPLLEQFEKCAVEIFANSTDYLFSDKGNILDSGKKYRKRLKFKLSEDELLPSDTSNIYSAEFNPFTDKQSADNRFEYEAFQLADDIRQKILKLKETGLLHLIGDMLEEILAVKPTLSSIFITNDYRIFLQDYGMKEVHMPPLSKALYILFLRHPEGIKFKHLPTYHDELLSIYKNVTVHENIDKAMDSIRALTDPMNNSINEKCSHIRAAFLKVIADELAVNYYVTGKKGEPKRIILDRSLVTFQ